MSNLTGTALTFIQEAPFDKGPQIEQQQSQRNEEET